MSVRNAYMRAIVGGPVIRLFLGMLTIIALELKNVLAVMKAGGVSVMVGMHWNAQVKQLNNLFTLFVIKN